ncbi:ATP-binding protein [Candidatus Bathyarchaeota archaeon]|nr:ATP-binding protein [Candidatus Bathyarchaeota archaeon]
MWGIILLHDVPVRSINEETLQALVKDGAREDKFLEFKESLSISTSDEKEEFLADVSSFANTAGGDLVLGMTETEGVASELRGMPIPDIDTETQRIESIIRDGIDPRILGIVIQRGRPAVEMLSGGGGRGQGYGRRRGGGYGGGGYAAGPGGQCVCTSCGYRAVHVTGQPCYAMRCPKCGASMTRG